MRILKTCLLVMICAFMARAALAAPPQRVQWTIDGVPREALVFASVTGSPRDTHPLVIAFHGHGGNMRGFAAHAGLQDQWPQAIIVYPQGLPTASRRDPQGRKPGWQRLAGDENDRDLKFFDAMLATLRSRYRVDDRRVFATGFSNGAFFSLLLWMQRSDVLAGFAIVAGALEPTQRLLVAKPVLNISGDSDPLVTPAKVQATIAEERGVNQARGAGQDCGRRCRLFRGVRADVTSITHPGGHFYPSWAAARTVDFFRQLNSAGSAATGAPSETVAERSSRPSSRDQTPGA
jgi:polyhydroxybutyrate depolymerase